MPRAGCGIRGAERASRRAAAESDLTASNALYVERPHEHHERDDDTLTLTNDASDSLLPFPSYYRLPRDPP